MLNEKLKIQIDKDMDLRTDLERYALASILRAICEQFDVTKEELLSKRRHQSLVLPRHIMYYLAYRFTGYTLPKLGSLLERDHTTILYAHDKIIQNKKHDNDLALQIEHAHMLALTHETERQKRLTQYREEVQEMIYRIKTERLNGL